MSLNCAIGLPLQATKPLTVTASSLITGYKDMTKAPTQNDSKANKKHSG